MIKGLNKKLSLFQLIGYTVVFIIIATYCVIEGRMMVFLIPMVALLFLPFVLISLLQIMNNEQHNKKLKIGIYICLILLVAPSLSLPMFYELGGLTITLVCIAIAAIVIYHKNNLKLQLVIINSIGCLLLTLVIVVLVWTPWE